MMMYKSIQDEDTNFKLKRITGNSYGASNGSSATFGSSRRTGSFRLWISFTRNVSSTDRVSLGSGASAQQKLLYNSANRLIKKYTGAERAQSTFYCIAFDRDAFGDYVSAPATRTFITSNGYSYTRKSSLTGNELYNVENYIPISYGAIRVGILFPRQGLYVHFNASYPMRGTTVVNWSPINYKAQAYYYRRLGRKQFNFSNNSSFDPRSMTRTYVTTVGLYGQRDPSGLNPTSRPLLAVAKLVTPMKKSDEVDALFKINLEY